MCYYGNLSPMNTAVLIGGRWLNTTMNTISIVLAELGYNNKNGY